jgi:hypothetical protein
MRSGQKCDFLKLTFPVKSDDNEEEMCYGRVDLMTEME